MAAETADRFAQAVASRALAEALTLGPAPDRQQADQAMGDAIRLFKELAFRPELARSRPRALAAGQPSCGLLLRRLAGSG